MATDFKIAVVARGPFMPRIDFVMDDEGIESVSGRDELKQRLLRLILAQMGDAPPGGTRRIGMPWVHHARSPRFPLMGQGGEPDDLQRWEMAIRQALSPFRIPEIRAVPRVNIEWGDAAVREIKIQVDVLLNDGTILSLDEFTVILQ